MNKIVELIIKKTQPFCFQILEIQIKISIIMKLQVTYIYNPY